MFRLLTPFFLAGLLILSQGCGVGDSPTTPTTTTPTPITGTYTLQSVNGQSLPWVIQVEIGDLAGMELTAGSITLNQDMTCSSSLTGKLTDSGTVSPITTTDVGTYTHANGAVTLTWTSDGSTLSGSIVGSQLTLADGSDVFLLGK